MSLSFALQVDEFVKRAKLAPDIVVRKVALGIHRDIVMGTPVDTGRARASWGVGLNRYGDLQVTLTDKNGNATTTRALASLASYRPGDSIWIGSALPYMERLEFGGWNGPTAKVTASGFSRQAPAGMVRISITRWNDHLTSAIRSLPK